MPPGDLRPVSAESIPIPPRDRVRVDDDETTGPRRSGGPERDPESPIDVVDMRARAILLQRHHLLPKSQVFDHEVGAPPTHRPDSTGAERDEEDEYTEHSGGLPA